MNREYASAAWNPSQACHIDRLQAIQRRGARYTLNRHHNRSSPTAMLQDLKWESLASRRIKLQLCIFYKIHSELIDVKFPPYVHLAAERNRRSHSAAYFEYHCQTDLYKNTFYPKMIRTWNSLSQQTVDAISLDQFKARLAPLSL